jgi:3-polyprenyl-4-hydroxybenzoate decarboxylase
MTTPYSPRSGFSTLTRENPLSLMGLAGVEALSVTGGTVVDPVQPHTKKPALARSRLKAGRGP